MIIFRKIIAIHIKYLQALIFYLGRFHSTISNRLLEPRINLNIELPEDETVGESRIGDDFSGNGNETNGGQSASVVEDAHQICGTNAGQTVIVEDQTSSLLCMESATARYIRF